MSPSCSYLPADCPASFDDDLSSLHGYCETYSDPGVGAWDASLHTASAYGPQWPSPQTLSPHEAELQNNYLDTQFTPLPALMDDMLLAHFTHDVPPADPCTITQGAGALDFYAQWYMGAADDGPYPLPSTYPPVLSSTAISGQPSAPFTGEQPSHTYAQCDATMPAPCSYPALAHALAYSEGAEYRPSPVEPARSIGDMARASSGTSSDNHCSPTAAHYHSAPPKCYSRASSSSPSRDNSPRLVARTVARRNAPAPLAAQHLRSPSTNRWECPYCPYVQTTRRSPDLKRHMKTHCPSGTSDEAEWICCGVPLEDAQAMGVPQEVLEEEVFVYGGEAMVGGCRKVFSRRDALKRHLDYGQ
ncbi:hypothetical protein ACG7TL_007196 [Trametes sanguinea]